MPLFRTGFGSAIFAVKPGDGSAREQAASCQKVLGGWVRQRTHGRPVLDIGPKLNLHRRVRHPMRIKYTVCINIAVKMIPIVVDMAKIRPMIAMPFHPSNTYTIEELNTNLLDILDETEKT